MHNMNTFCLYKIYCFILCFVVSIATRKLGTRSCYFQQFTSERAYYGANSTLPPLIAPFPHIKGLNSTIVRIQLAGKEIITGNKDSGVVFLQTIRGDIFLLQTLQGLDEVLHAGIPTLPIGSTFATTRDGIVVCSPTQCQWFICDKNNGCKPDAKARFQYNIGIVSAMDVDSNDDIWVGGLVSGLLHITRKGMLTAIAVVGNVTAITIDAHNNNNIAVGTSLAVYYKFNKTSMSFSRWVQATSAMMDGMPLALTFMDNGELWIGGQWSLNVIRIDGITVDRIAGSQGLPSGNITILAGDGSGTLWAGTQNGVAMYNMSKRSWRYFSGDRWIPGQVNSNVTALAVINEGLIVVATEFGLAYLRSINMTFEQKAAFYTNLTSTLLSRHGWVASVELAKYGDTNTLIQHPGDNDGLWTGMLTSGLIYQYALTGAEYARIQAWHHYAAVEFLHNVTETNGFIARTAVKCGEPHGPGDSGICPHGSPNTCGWVNSTACYAGIDSVTTNLSCCWTWKRDTSSDEVTGHFFTMLLAWKFLARNDAEKTRIASTLCATADYILKGKLRFIDPIYGAIGTLNN